MGPRYFASQRRMVLIGQKPGEGSDSDSVRLNREYQAKLEAFVREEVGFEELNHLIASHLLSWRIFKGKGIFREGGAGKVALLADGFTHGQSQLHRAAALTPLWRIEGAVGVELALLGALGLSLGISVALTLGSFINYAEVPIAALAVAVVGASLGVAFRDWTTILALAVAGAVGSSVGLLAGDFLRFHLPMLRGLGEGWSIIVAGVIAGASLGAALGYLEHRKQAEERRARVR